MAKGGPVGPPAPDRKLLIPRHHRVLATHTWQRPWEFFAPRVNPTLRGRRRPL